MNFIYKYNPSKELLIMAWIILLCVSAPTIAIIILTVVTAWAIYNEVSKLSVCR